MKKTLTIAVSVMTVISMSVSSFAMELLKKGSRGEDVREVQEMLIASGYMEDGKADGIFGPKTEKAVLAFQQDKALDATGIVGEGTYNALKENGAGQEAEEAPAEEAPEEEVQTEEAPAETPSGSEADAAEAFPSWNPDSASLKELVDFVAASTDESDPGYLEPADRVAVFDMDGTILCEKAPVYFDYCLTMYRVLDDPTCDATEEEWAAMQEVREDVPSRNHYQGRPCRFGLRWYDTRTVSRLCARLCQ